MNKLKKYHCYTSKYNLEYLSKFKITNLRTVDDDKISFYVDKENYDQISKIINLEENEIGLKRIKNLLQKHIITIFGVILIIIALLSMSNNVTEVKFTNPDTYNEEILDYLSKYYKHVGPFRYLNDNLNNINYDLRKTFYHYEWIGIRKNGSYLYIDIKDIKNINYDNDPRPGSYYAKYDGIVKRYHLEKGIVLVQEEQYVAKGEKLISGEILHHDAKIENIRAKGYVIAEVLQYQEFTFKKENLEKKRTGKLISTSEFYLFGLKIGKSKNTFQEFDKEEKTNINILNFFKQKEVFYYEVKSVKNVYSEEDAINYAKSLVEKEFRSQKVNPFEKIIFNELVKIQLEDNNYYVKLIVKTYQNIAEFIPDEIR